MPPTSLQKQRRGRPPQVLVVAQQQQPSSASSIINTTAAITSSTTTIRSTKSTTDINVDVISNDIITYISNDDSQSLLLCCAIPDCVEYCNSAISHICMNCPPKSRCYLYCVLHELHASHKNQSSCRRSNTSIRSDNNNTTTSSSTSNNNATNSKNSSGTSNNNSSSSSNTNTRRTPARNRKRSLEEEELCTCGCNNTIRNSKSMTDRKGTDCRNRVHFACVPNTWLCFTCSNR